MGAFGGPTEKATRLVGDVSYLPALSRTPSAADHLRFVDEDHEMVTRGSDGSVSGGSDLKISQAYPREYAEEVIKLFDEHLRAPAEIDSDSDDSDIADDVECDNWEDAGLDRVCKWLDLPSDRLCF